MDAMSRYALKLKKYNKLPTRNVKRDTQEMQHKKEDNFLDFLSTHYTEFWTNYKDVHDDFSTGVDVYLDNVPYDLKVSDSCKLSLFKKHNGQWYSPLLMHMDVNYLYVVEHEDYYNLYEFTKADLLEMIFEQGIHTGAYSGDGNKNITFTVDLSKARTEYALVK